MFINMRRLTQCALLFAVALVLALIAIDVHVSAADCSMIGRGTTSKYSNTCVTDGNLSIATPGVVQIGVKIPAGASHSSITKVTYSRVASLANSVNSNNNSGELTWNSKYGGFLEQYSYGLGVKSGAGLGCQSGIDQNRFNITVITASGQTSSGQIDICELWNTGASHSGPATITFADPTSSQLIAGLGGSSKSATGTITGQWQTKRSDGKTYPIAPQGVTSLTLTGPRNITFKQTSATNGQVTSVKGISLSSGSLSIADLPPGTYNLTFNYDDTFSTAHNTDTPNPPTTVTKNKLIVVAGQTTKATSGVETLGPPASQGNSNDTPTCESNGGVSWILCSIFNGLADVSDFMMKDLVQPLLLTEPIDTSTSGSTYQVWSNFRVYGDVFLVIALLVVVFGQSIGGGMIDAYTAKKVLPRLLIAAVLINLSLYIVALMIDITNIVGAGIGSLLTAPLKDAGQFHFTLSGAQQAGISLGATLGIGAFITTLLVAHGSILGMVGDAIPFVMLFVIMPIVFSLIAAVCTIIVRKGLILFLVMVSPVAFALYCLPNTEKYFKQWWDLLFKTMLVYPIIMVLFAVADILSVTIMQANGLGHTPLLNQSIGGTAGTVVAATSTNILSALLALVALFLPLFMIPYSFRMAGGLLGRIHEVATNAHKKTQETIKGNPNDPFSMRNMARRRAGNGMLSIREHGVGAGVGLQKSNSRVGRFVGKRLAGFYGSGNYEVRRSLRNKEASEMVASQVSTGGDNTVRAAFARRLKYMDDGKVRTGWFGTDAIADRNGFVTNGLEPKFADSEVAKAKQLFGNNQSMYQAALTYEIGKAGSDEELANIQSVNSQNMRDYGMTFDQGNIWTGAAYAHQQDRRELKHTKIQPDGTYKRNAYTFTREIAENVSNYPLSNMRTSTIKALREDHAQATATLASTSATTEEKARAQTIQDYVRSTADSLNARMQGRGSFALAGEEGSESPIAGGQTGAAGLVNQEIQGLIDDVTAARPAQGGGARGGGSGNAPPPTVSGGPNRGGVLLG